MNNFTAITIVSFETRSWRHRGAAALWCKNYGLSPILKNIYAGTLYAKERTALVKKFESTFTKKTERFFISSVCRTCFESSSFNGNLKEEMDGKMEPGPAFEIIQIGQKTSDGRKTQ